MKMKSNSDDDRASTIAEPHASDNGKDAGVDPDPVIGASGNQVAATDKGMNASPSEILDAFFAISPRQIAADLRDQEPEITDRERLMERLCSSDKIPAHIRSARQWATYHHENMLVAHLHSLYLGQKDLRVLWVSQPIEKIADLACSTAHEEGRLAELSAALDEIARSEGFSSAKALKSARAEQPPAFEALAREEKTILLGIGDTMFVEIARRYRLNSIADLFENNRLKYAVMREVGRRLDPMWMDSQITEEQRRKWEACEEEKIRSIFGEKAIDLLQKRLVAVKRKLGPIVDYLR